MSEIPPPLGGRWVGGWVSRKFQHFGPPGTPPPPRGAGALFFFFLGFGLCRALRPVCIFHTFFTFFFILCQSSEPFVAHHCQNWLLVKLVVVLNSKFKVLGFNPSGGNFLLVSFALLFHRFSSACM